MIMLMLIKNKEPAEYRALEQIDFDLCMILKKACGHTVYEQNRDGHDEASEPGLTVGPRVMTTTWYAK